MIMKLCDYGCGQEAKYKLKSKKYCCSKNWQSCPTSKNKFSDGKEGFIPWNRGVPHSKETRKKISNSKTGKTLGKDNPFYKKKHTYEVKLKMRKNWMKNHLNNLKTINQIQNEYPILAKIEEMRYEPGKENKLIIQVHCKNHNCINSKEQGGWFTPIRSLIFTRAYAIKSGADVSNLYCSEKCKQECSLFDKKPSQLIKEDQIKAGIIKESLYTSAEYQLFRRVVLDREEEICEYCGKPANTVHHIMSQKLEPWHVLDPDYGVACCTKCHYKYGHKDECGTGVIASKIC